MNRNKSNHLGLWLPVIIALSVITGILLGNIARRNSPGPLPLKVFTQADKLSNIMGFIESNYVDSVDRKSIDSQVIEEVLKKLDPHSIYLPPRDLKAANETLRGNFDGIGVQFNMQEDTILVIQAVRGGPSEKVGILAGDRIVSVEDRIVAGVKMNQDSIVDMLRGPRGTKVRVGIVRREVEEPLEFLIPRGKIPIYSVDVGYMVDEEVGYIKINTFSQSTYQEFKDHLKSLKKQGASKLILDLRGNAGGIMSPAIKIADEFLPDRTLIVYTEGRARKREEYHASSSQLGEDIELVVLLDEGSASASEIVAGAIQDNDRGWIVGRRSFGKGLVQEQATLSDGSAIRITTARYYTPSGRCIQRSYKNGKEDYYMDFHRRFQNGELLEQDSIHLVDSLKYITPKGRILYGGGGIMPDLFVPYDTIGITPYLRRLTNRGLVYRFALSYADNNRSKLVRQKTAQDISNYLDQTSFVEEFNAFADANGVKSEAVEAKESEEIVITQLKAYIARNLIDNDGFYPIIKDIDTTLKSAMSLLHGDLNIR